MKKLFALLKECLSNNTDAVLVTVVASSGSTPRGMGARMLVTKQGRISGTVGGGAVESRSETVALEVLHGKSSRVEYFRLKKNEIEDLGMVCGGNVNIYFEYICAARGENLLWVEKILELFEAEKEFWLVNEISENGEGGITVCGRDTTFAGCPLPAAIFKALANRPVQVSDGGKTYYCEKMLQAGQVYIFGGGHVSQALVPALTAIDFRCVVLEDREEFCKKELFPGVEKVLLIDNDHVEKYVHISHNDYVCVMTRGHKADLTILAQILKTPAAYIGVIGSKGKKAGVFQKLLEQGVTNQDLERVTTPIGLDIGAETAQEIAVSITAQLLQKRARKV